MGKHGKNVHKIQRDSNLVPTKSSSTKRKKDSPVTVDQSEKKTKHSDTESSTSEKWLDIDLPSDSEGDNTIEMADNAMLNYTHSHDNITMIPSNAGTPIAAMSTPALQNQPQMLFNPQQMYGMPSPIIQQQHPNISDSDAIRIATIIKEMISKDLAEMIEQQVEIQIKPLRTEIDALKEENSQLRKDLNKACANHDELEQYSRRTCVRIGNVRESEGESTDDIVLNVCQKSGANISINDIDRSHRVGKHKQGKHREIIVKFVSYKARTTFIKSRKTLRENRCDIYLNEDLTRARKNIAYYCRFLKKDKNSVVQAAWTFDGRQYIKTDKDITVKIDTLTDLQTYGLKPEDIKKSYDE